MINKENKNGMIMRYPATRWQDALPTGSGIVGALLYGNIENDTIILNHDSLYYPNNIPPVVDVSDKLPEMRKLILNGNYRKSAQLMRNTYDERKEPDQSSGGLDPYQPFCSIHLSTITDGPFRKYRRGIDFDTGRTWVKWDDNKASFTREVFVSRVTDNVYLRLNSSKPGLITCKISLDKTRSEQLDENGICHSSLRNSAPQSYKKVSEEERILTFIGNYPDGFSFGSAGHLSASGGTVHESENCLIVEGADEIEICIKLFLGEDPDEAIERISNELKTETESFDTAFSEHVSIHSEIFNRVSLELGKNKRLSNEEMLMEAYDGDVPSGLIKTMFDFGRYLLICSSRSGGFPANLQGIWNGDYSPAWNCDFHTDENIQMNYWPAMPAQLAETLLPFFEYFEKYMDDFRLNAKNNYGASGIHVPLAMTRHGLVNPHNYGAWTAAAGWLAQHFYDYYLYTGDLDFLRERAVPWLKETALFYEDFLIEGDDGKLLFVPSVSPENRPANCNSLISMNATMDVAICREVLTNLCNACELLKIESEGVKRWKDMLNKLPDYKVNKDGAIKEWQHPAFEDNYHHRHQSHIYPLFPGLEVTKESNPEIFEACRIAVEKRLVIGLTSQTGWSMAHMANIYARLQNGDRSLECLEILLRGSTGPNLFTYHNDWRKMGLSCSSDIPPFQIDANFGITAAIMEMLVFSKPGLIKLLPALPEKWSTGCVSGIACRGEITADMQWNMKTGEFNAEIISRKDQDVRIYLPEFTLKGKSPYQDVSLKKGIPFQIKS